MKKCTLCDKEKESSDFYKNRSFKDGLACWCILCSRTESKKIRDANKEKERTRNARWKSANQDKVKSKNKEHYDKNKVALKQHTLARLLVPENKQKVLESARNWRLRNKDRVRNANSEWKKNHPESDTVYKQNRRARKNNNGGKFSISEWKELKEMYGNQCLSCKQNNVPLQPDHVVPLALGGRNSIDNIQPLCQHCNCTKYTKIIDYRESYNTER